MKEEVFLYNYECSLPSLIKLNEDLKFNFKNLTKDPNDLLKKEKHCNLISIIGDDPEIQKKFTMLFLFKNLIDISQKPEYDKIYLTYNKIDEYPIIILNYSISNDYFIQKNLSTYNNYSLFEKIQDYKISRNCIKNFISKYSLYIYFLIEENNNNKIDFDSFLDIYSQEKIYYFHYTKNSYDYLEQLETILEKQFFFNKNENKYIEKHILDYYEYKVEWGEEKREEREKKAIFFEHYIFLADKDYNCDKNKKLIDNFLRFLKIKQNFNKTKEFIFYFEENLKKFYNSFFDNKYNLKYKDNIFSLEDKGNKKIISENLIDIFSDKKEFYYTAQSQENQIFYIEGNIDTIRCEKRKEDENRNKNKIIALDFFVEYEKEIKNLDYDDQIIFKSIDSGKEEYSIPNVNYGIKDFDYIEDKKTKENGIIKLEFKTY